MFHNLKCCMRFILSYLYFLTFWFVVSLCVSSADDQEVLSQHLHGHCPAGAVPSYPGSCVCRGSAASQPLKRGFNRLHKSETHPGQLSNRENPDVQPNNGDEVREKTNHQPGATWSLRPPDNVVGDYLVIKIPGGDLSAAAPGREADKSVSRLRQQIFKSINCVTQFCSAGSHVVSALLTRPKPSL